MIRIIVTDEQRSVDIRVDADYSPDVWEDIATRALRLLLTNEIPAVEPLEAD